MNVKKWVVGVTALLLVWSSSFALYYRSLATRLLDEKTAPPGTSKPALAASETRDTVRTGTMAKPASRSGVARAVASRPRAAAAPTAPAKITADASQQQTSSVPADRPRRGGTAWLDSMRTNDPARYEAFQQRREQMREKAQNAWLDTIDYFASRDTSNMGAEDMNEFGMMMQVLEETRTMTDRLQAGLPREERREVMHAVWSNVVVLTPMLESERNKELYDMALAMGHKSSEAASLVVYVNQISSNTSINSIFPDATHGGLMPHGRWPGAPPREPNRPAQ